MNESVINQINGCDIRRVENGYVLTVGSSREWKARDSASAEYAFETFPAMVDWMADNLAGASRKYRVPG